MLSHQGVELALELLGPASPFPGRLLLATSEFLLQAITLGLKIPTSLLQSLEDLGAGQTVLLGLSPSLLEFKKLVLEFCQLTASPLRFFLSRFQLASEIPYLLALSLQEIPQIPTLGLKNYLKLPLAPTELFHFNLVRLLAVRGGLQ
jgi:hypothetical protein